MGAPPALELEIARRFGVDLGIEIVLLRPQRVRRIQVLEVGDQPGAVELAVAEVAQQRRRPAAAHQAAGVAHRVLAVHAGPIGQRRTGEHDRAEQLRPDRGQHHQRPAGLAVADDTRLALGVRVPGDHRLDEFRLGMQDVLDRLPGDGLGQEADEIARVAGLQRDADLAVGLEAADAGTVARTRIDHDERHLAAILNFRRAFGRDNADERIVDRALEPPSVDQDFDPEAQDMRGLLRDVLLILVAALPQDIEEQDAALPAVDEIVRQSLLHPSLLRRRPGVKAGAVRPACGASGHSGFGAHRSLSRTGRCARIRGSARAEIGPEPDATMRAVRCAR
jgi:hypothetical protein